MTYYNDPTSQAMREETARLNRIADNIEANRGATGTGPLAGEATPRQNFPEGEVHADQALATQERASEQWRKTRHDTL
jgi:hypothetical protein